MNKSDKERFTIDISDEHTTLISKKSDSNKKRDGQEMWVYVGKIGEIGFGIAIPIVLGAFAGSFIDEKFLMYPKATLGGIMIGLVISVFTFIKTIQMIIENKL
jgi:hypothetical protein